MSDGKEILTEDEKEIIECLVAGWRKSGCSLYGNLCYKQVDELMEKLGVKLSEKPSDSAFKGVVS